MDPVTMGAVLLAIVTGVSEALSGQLWAGVTSLVRRPFHRKTAAGTQLSSGESEMAALLHTPGDQQKALVLAEVLLARAGADAGFEQALKGWWEQAAPIRASIGAVTNTISGGTQHGPVLQGRDFSGITFSAPPVPAPEDPGRALIADDASGTTRNTFAGGTAQGPVLQGRNFINTTFVTRQAAAAPVALAQLPAPVGGFTGRDRELAQVAALLDPAAAGGSVVVSAVAGLAGVGKTALAIQAGHAARAAGWFAGGALFIDLHGYDDAPVQPGQALDALLRALGIPGEHIPPGIEERAGLYRSVLAAMGDPVLIIADNASSEAQARPLMPGAGAHRVVVTSRHTLAGLGARLLDITVLDEQAAVALLDQGLRATRPDDDRISRDRAAANSLIRICGGLPLALRIIAALLAADPSLTVRELADELTDEIHRLAALHYDDGGGTSAPSVAAAFELSYRQLDEAAARMFRLLPVNPGPDVSTMAAAALADWPVSETRKVIGQLIKAHLVEVGTGAAARWRMHDLLRLYARQLSDAYADADGRNHAHDRLLGYYVDTTRAADTHVRALPGTPVPERFAGRDEALAWLDEERANLIAAVTIAASSSRDQVAMRLPLSLTEYLLWRRRFDDWLAVAAISRDAARRLGHRPGEASALLSLGFALVEARRFAEAISTCQAAAAIYRETGDWHGEGMALGNLGLALEGVRRFDEAISAHQAAVSIFRETGDRRREGMALNNLGRALEKVRRFDEAIGACHDAVAIYRETGDRHTEGTALTNLGVALREVRRFDEAISACHDAVAIYQETGDRHGEGSALNNLGRALQGVRRFDEAISAYHDAVAIFREIGDRYGEGTALGNLGIALGEVRRFDEAIGACQDVVAIYQETGDRHDEGMALNNLGLALAVLRRFDEAIRAYHDAVAIFRETGDRHGEDIALNNLKLDQAEQEKLGS
jgi:tetratricopeptide (TPR) repeat protein